MLFYGSLMDPEVLQALLNLPSLPPTRPASISRFKIKMWGIYSALIPVPSMCDDGSSRVTGTVWEVKEELSAL